MSALTDRIADEHHYMPRRRYKLCACGSVLGAKETMCAHIAEVTEAAVREQVARDIEEARSQAPAYRAHIRRQMYSYRNRPAYTWAVFVTTSSGRTVYSDDGFPTMRAAVNAGLFDIAARDHVWRVCAGIGDWR